MSQAPEKLTPAQWDALWHLVQPVSERGNKWEPIEEWIAEQRRAAFKAEHDAADQAGATGTAKDEDLVYAAHSRCPCGAGLAYHKGIGMHGYWDCADILTGRAVASGQPGAKKHTDRLPFAFYEVKSENQPSANGATTRPKAAAA